MQFPWQQYANSERRFDTALRMGSQGEVLDWQALSQRIEDCVEILRQHQLKAGEGLALQGKNQFALLCYYLAGLQLGARVLTLNPSFSAEKTTVLCQQNDIKLCIDFWENTLSFVRFTALNATTNYPARTMTLTSGSTGFPKAVVHSIQAHLANAAGVCELMQFEAHHSWLLSLPLYHVSGQGILWRWLLQGAELHLPDEDFYAAVLRATHASLVPTQALRLMDYMQQMPKSAVKLQRVLLGGAYIPVEISEKLTALGIKNYVGYGLTEMASTVCAKLADGKPGVGSLLLGRECQIQQEAVWLRGAGLAEGYWKNGNIEPLTNGKGWFESKDRGMWQENELHILGRLDNMFISGGENIQPEEIEQVILQYPSVEQAVVLPVEDAEFGQRPAAMVKFNAEFSQSAVENLQVFLQAKLEKFKLPIGYFPLEIENRGQIKISRADLKKQLALFLGKNV